MTFTSPTITRSFAGDLELEDQTVPVSVAFHEGQVRLILGGETVGSWPLAEVEFLPEGSAFDIKAEGDSIRFLPYDRIAFSAFVAPPSEEPALPPHHSPEPDPPPSPAGPTDGPPTDTTVDDPQTPKLFSDQGRFNLEPDFLDVNEGEPTSLLEPPDSPDEMFAAGLSGPTGVPVPQFRSGLVSHDPAPVEEEAPTPPPEPDPAPEPDVESSEETPGQRIDFESDAQPSAEEQPPPAADSEPLEKEPEAMAPEPAPTEPAEQALEADSEGSSRLARTGLALLNRLRDASSPAQTDGDQPEESVDQAPALDPSDPRSGEPTPTDTITEESPQAAEVEAISDEAGAPEPSAGASTETAEPAQSRIPGMALLTSIREAWTATDSPVEPTDAEESDNTPEPLDDAENLRQWALVVAGGVVVLVVVGIVAWGVAAVIGGENPVAEEPAATSVATEATRAIPEPDPTTTAAPATTVTPENASAAQEFVGQWNNLATRYAYHLSISGDRLPISTAPAPTVHLTYDEDGILRLSMAPKGAGSDRDLLLAMGLAVAWGDPGLSPEDRKSVLSSLGVDVDDPQVADIGGELTRNGVTYRTSMENEVLRFEVIPRT